MNFLKKSRNYTIRPTETPVVSQVRIAHAAQAQALSALVVMFDITMAIAIATAILSNTAWLQGDTTRELWKLSEEQKKAVMCAIVKIASVPSNFFENPDVRFAVLYDEMNFIVCITGDCKVFLVRNDHGFPGKVRGFYWDGPEPGTTAAKLFSDVYDAPIKDSERIQ